MPDVELITVPDEPLQVSSSCSGSYPRPTNDAVTSWLDLGNCVFAAYSASVISSLSSSASNVAPFQTTPVTATTTLTSLITIITLQPQSSPSSSKRPPDNQIEARPADNVEEAQLPISSNSASISKSLDEAITTSSTTGSIVLVAPKIISSGSSILYTSWITSTLPADLDSQQTLQTSYTSQHKSTTSTFSASQNSSSTFSSPAAPNQTSTNPENGNPKYYILTIVGIAVLAILAIMIAGIFMIRRHNKKKVAMEATAEALSENSVEIDSKVISVFELPGPELSHEISTSDGVPVELPADIKSSRPPEYVPERINQP
jgi:hypothetical protein